jgi:hypothetical protein
MMPGEEEAREGSMRWSASKVLVLLFFSFLFFSFLCPDAQRYWIGSSWKSIRAQYVSMN